MEIRTSLGFCGFSMDRGLLFFKQKTICRSSMDMEFMDFPWIEDHFEVCPYGVQEVFYGRMGFKRSEVNSFQWAYIHCGPFETSKSIKNFKNIF